MNRAEFDAINKLLAERQQLKHFLEEFSGLTGVVYVVNDYHPLGPGKKLHSATFYLDALIEFSAKRIVDLTTKLNSLGYED